MRKIFSTLALLALMAAASFSMADETGGSPATASGELQLVPGSGDIQQVWMKPGTDLSSYRSVYLVEPAVSFRKNWLRDQNRGHPSMRVKPSDMEDIADDIKALMTKVFTERLLASGFTFSEVRNHDVLIIKPAVLKLDVNAPDVQVPNVTDILTSTAGSMTLYMELYDSVSEELLVKVVHPVADPEAGIGHWQRKVANQAAFKRMMKPLAEALVNGFGTY
jgi:hypothetical protein